MTTKIIDIDVEFDDIHFDENDIKRTTRISKMALTKKGSKGPKHTPESKKRISESGKGIKKPARTKQVKAIVSEKLTGRKRTKEECKAISEGLKGHTVSEERRKNISTGLTGVMKGVPKRTTKCPHCGKIGGIAPMKRFHFDNCKQK